MANTLNFCQFSKDEFNALNQVLSSIFRFDPAGLSAQYDCWRSNFLTEKEVDEISLTYQSNDLKFQQFVETSQVVGADLPITLASSDIASTNQTVMFIAQDPKRDPKTTRCERITLGTPFALHSPWGRQTGVNTRLVFQAVQFWLEKGWRAYLTDVIKLYAFDETRGKARQLPKADRETFYTMLAAEIDIFQPDVIVTIGAPAYHAIQSLQPSVRTIAVPHFSGSNQKEWKKRLESGQRITNAAKLTWYRQHVKTMLGESAEDKLHA